MGKKSRHDGIVRDRKNAGGPPLSLAQLCSAPSTYLPVTRIEDLNLVCAQGLPNAEAINFPRIRNWLDSAARMVNFETRRHRYRFEKSPGTYRNSPGFFCCYSCSRFCKRILVSGTTRRGSRSELPRPQLPRPRFSRLARPVHSRNHQRPGRDLCIDAGAVYGGRPATGYPLRLVEARGHLFFRWDDPLGRSFGSPNVFNVEGAGEGIASHSDDYYRKWPEPSTSAEHEAGCYLRSLTPARELALFLSTRGECFESLGQLDGAI